MVLKNKKKINWKKGSAEIIGFVIVLPAMMLILMGLIGVAQLGLARNALEQAAYIGCRAAVVREDKESAQNAAENAVRMRLEQGTFGLSSDDIVVTLEPVAGITDTETGNTPKWVKGSMVDMSVEVKINTFLPFFPDTMQTHICMMVEQPAEVFG